MSNEIATHNALQAYRGLVAETVKEAADMTIHIEAVRKMQDGLDKEITDLGGEV